MTIDRTNWNSRYLEYCRVNEERDPEKMLARDREKYPGGVMVGFSLWIQQKWRQWYASLGPCDGRYVCLISGHIRELHQDHVAFDRWLAKEQS
jgi:hypothetical protein